jgi:hypothetical protein
MRIETFSAICLTLKNQSKVLDDLNSLNVSLVNFVDPYYDLISRCVEDFYGKDGLGWFEWFCYENEFGERDWSKTPGYKEVDGKIIRVHEAGEFRHGAHDEEGNPICHSIISTWEYLENNFKIVK